MLRILFIFTFFFIAINNPAQTEWENTFGLPDSSFALDMIQVQDGDFVLYGGTNAFTENSNAFLLKFKENGDSVWFRDLGFHVHPYEGTLIEANNGDLIVCGEKIMRCNDMGNELWTLNQASVDIDEADDGTLFSVNYDRVYKIDGSGNIGNEQIVGVTLEAFTDSILVLSSLDTTSTFSQIEMLNDSLFAISGIFLDNSAPWGFEGWGPRVDLLKTSDLSQKTMALKFRDSIDSEILYTLKRTDLFGFFNLDSSVAVNLMPDIPTMVYITKIGINSLDSLDEELQNVGIWCESFSNFSNLLNPILNKHVSTFSLSDEIFYGLGSWVSTIFTDYKDYSIYQIVDSVGACQYWEPFHFGIAEKPDNFSHIIKSSSTAFLSAGVKDYETFSGVGETWGNSTQFVIAKIDPQTMNCVQSDFTLSPTGLFEEQASNATRLKWNHYSDKADACILKGGPIDGTETTSPFLQNPGSLLVQGSNIEGDIDGFDFSNAFPPDANFTLFNSTLFPDGVSAELIPGAFYKWKVRCGCLVNPDLPLPQRLQGSNVVLSPWSEWDVFENLD